MTFERGLAVIETNDTETKGFFIDQDALEFARLNAKLDKQRMANEKAQKKVACKQSKAAKAKAQRKAYTLKTVGYILANCAICGAVTWAGIAGLIHPIISAPVSVFCMCVACVRFGAWFGRVVKK
jgi:hypothetical protein